MDAVVELEHAGLSLINATFVIAVLKDIVMIPVRSTPWDSEKELDELYDVFLLVKEKWKTDVSSIVLLIPSLRNSCVTFSLASFFALNVTGGSNILFDSFLQFCNF